MSSSHAACLLSMKVPEKKIGAVGVEVLVVVVRGVVMSLRSFRLATDFEKHAWVEFHPVDELRFVLREEDEVC
jgi:hypothetical protein